MLNKEISEVEKGCGKWIENYDRDGDHEHRDDISCGTKDYNFSPILCEECQEKLSTLKSAQAKFDKFVEEELEFLKSLPTQSGKSSKYQRDRILKRIDELSSKQEKIE